MISLNLNGKSTLKLEIEAAGDGTHGDHADWAITNIEDNFSGSKPEAWYQIQKVEPFILTPSEKTATFINSPLFMSLVPICHFYVESHLIIVILELFEGFDNDTFKIVVK